jgi:hypothetical protein
MVRLLSLALLLCLTGPGFAQQKSWEKCNISKIPQASFQAGKGVSRTKYPGEKTEEINQEGQGDTFVVGPDKVVRTMVDPTDESSAQRIYTIDKTKSCQCQFSGKNLTAVKFPVSFTYPDDPEVRKRDMEIFLRPGSATAITKIVLSGEEQYMDLKTDRKVPVNTVHTFLK